MDAGMDAGRPAGHGRTRRRAGALAFALLASTACSSTVAGRAEQDGTRSATGSAETGPPALSLAAPPLPLTCPDLSAQLSEALREPVEPVQSSRGVCRFGLTRTSAVVSITIAPDVVAEQARANAVRNRAGRAAIVDLPQLTAGGFGAVAADGGDAFVDVPTPSGTGLWVFSLRPARDYRDPLAELAAVARVADRTW